MCQGRDKQGGDFEIGEMLLQPHEEEVRAVIGAIDCVIGVVVRVVFVERIDVLQEFNNRLLIADFQSDSQLVVLKEGDSVFYQTVVLVREINVEVAESGIEGLA